MVEIRFHGRGGQGTVIAGKILADAVSKEDKYVQAFPQFGVERRGAPVSLSSASMKTRSTFVPRSSFPTMSSSSILR
jgi:2-oxoacid:acceptor oxidoreductase gamma subunit (pyruvate/2-ketoisovalerate family)